MGESVNNLRFLVWNLERQSLASQSGRLQHQCIKGAQAHIAVLTETWIGWDAILGGFEVSVFGATWSKTDPEERKILMWSGQPWRDVETARFGIANEERIIAATTDTPIGPVRVVGVCIAYHGAMVRHPEHPQPMWAEHRAYIEQLAAFMARQPSDLPLLIGGDYNQRIPGKFAPRDLRASLIASLGTARVVTDGDHGDDKVQLIDHLALSPNLKSSGLDLIIPPKIGTRPVSDHIGAVVSVEMAD